MEKRVIVLDLDDEGGDVRVLVAEQRIEVYRKTRDFQAAKRRLKRAA